ncbi:DNA-processing protein DprA [Candidatus Saccharibacteria bacterium]|nr:DNA-processing protein DprA [Candidatus Saccharibacteria bacterium]
MDVNILKLNEPNFPECLSVINTPPQQIYWTGADPKEWLTKPKVAIVGSRKATAYGRGVTTKLAKELAETGVVIISGLAYGIDVVAHQAALAANGITVAVLPTGLDQIYPAAHANIGRQILLHGSLITEYKQASPGFKANFIARNRIVSALADVLLITEAAVNSGSLHTARFALEQGKTVMAIPGNINSPTSEGCNNLIKSGALPVTSIEDVFFALKINPKDNKTKRAFSGSKHEQLVFEFIKEGVSAQEDIAAASRLDGPALASALTMLELSGYIRPAGGGNWVLS